MDCGTEIRLYDPRRKPLDWTELIGPTDCAVFLKDRTTSIPLTPDGRAFPSQSQVSCIMFRDFAAAQRFCDEKVQALPQLRCEIYDAEGLAHPPLAVILHPEHQQKEDSGSLWSRRRKSIAGVFFLISLGLFWMSARSSNSRDLAIFLGINCVFIALRFLYWDAGLKNRERERLKRVENHRKMERGDA